MLEKICSRMYISLSALYIEFIIIFTGSFSCPQISGRLFSDSGPRRSSRLAGEAVANTNVSAANNGTTNSTKYLGGSKLNSITLRSMAVRKGQSFANENIDEGNNFFCLTSICCMFKYA